MSYKTRFAAFFSVMILFNLAANFAHPVTPTVIQELGLNDYMFGVALAAMMLTNFLLSPFWGKINSYISSKTSMLICCCGYGVAQIWFAYAQTELMIILARMFAGLFTGGVFVSFLTYVVSVARPEDQGKYLTYTATIKSVAGAFGYLVGGFLGEISVRLSFLAQAGLLITVAVLFFFICQPDSTTSLKEISAGQLVREANPFQAFIDSRKFMTVAFALLFAVNIFTNFGNTGFDQAFNYYLKDELGLTSSYNGIVKALVGFISFAANMTICIWIINHTKMRRSLMAVVLVCSLSAPGSDRLLQHRPVRPLQRGGLRRLFRERAGAPEHGRQPGAAGGEKSGDGLFQRHPVPGKHRRFPDSWLHLLRPREAALHLHLCGLRLGRAGGRGLYGSEEEKMTKF